MSARQGTKTFVVQYTNAEGRTRRVKLGRFGVLAVDRARDLAKVKLGQVAAGEDGAARGRTGLAVLRTLLTGFRREEAQAMHKRGQLISVPVYSMSDVEFFASNPAIIAQWRTGDAL